MSRNQIILACLAATSVFSAIVAFPQRYDDHESTLWQFDKYRQEQASVKKQEKLANEFNRTNTDPRLSAMVTRNMLFEWHWDKGDRELGYRIDGTVVWRPLPEAK